MQVQILLNILLTMGIIVLIILGIIAILALLVLFAPVRYRIKAEFNNDIRFVIKLRWLAGIISYAYDYPDNEGRLRILGFRTGGRRKKKAGKKTGEKTVKDKAADKSEEIIDENRNVNLKEKEKKEYEPVERKVNNRLKTGNIKIDNKKKHRSRRTVNPLKRIKNRIKSTLTSIKKLIYEIRREENKRLILFGKDMLIKIIKRIRPKKIKAELIIGFEDPSHTGLFFGLLGLVTTFWKGRYKLTPDFENAVLKGYATAKGKIRGITAVCYFMQIIRNEDVKRVMNKNKKG